jgi:hypothetical protein
VLFFDDVNTFDTTLAAVNGVENLLSQWIYFEIAYDGGTALTYSYSFNGLPGTYVLAFTGSTSTLGAAATHVGIGGEVKNASASATLFLADWFKAG